MTERSRPLEVKATIIHSYLRHPNPKQQRRWYEVDVSHDLRLKDRRDKTSKTPILQTCSHPLKSEISIPIAHLQIKSTQSPQASPQHPSPPLSPSSGPVAQFPIPSILGSTVGAKSKLTFQKSRTNTSAEFPSEPTKVTWSS